MKFDSLHISTFGAEEGARIAPILLEKEYLSYISK